MNARLTLCIVVTATAVAVASILFGDHHLLGLVAALGFGVTAWLNSQFAPAAARRARAAGLATDGRRSVLVAASLVVGLGAIALAVSGRSAISVALVVGALVVQWVAWTALARREPAR